MQRKLKGMVAQSHCVPYTSTKSTQHHTIIVLPSFPQFSITTKVHEMAPL